jgi:hypothetical protein
MRDLRPPTAHEHAARLDRRRFVFFSSVFTLASLATWFVADLFWRDRLSVAWRSSCWSSS